MNPPLSADDLRAIADAIDAVESEEFCINPLLGRVEVLRPGSDDVIGHLVPQDGEWYGFEAKND